LKPIKKEKSAPKKIEKSDSKKKVDNQIKEMP